MGKLNPKQIENLTTPGKYEDGDGLRLLVKPGGTKSWILRYQFASTRREMGLGAYPSISLKNARLEAAAQRSYLARGIDPLERRRDEAKARREAQQASQANKVNFETLAHEYLTAHGADWSSKWRKGWLRKLQLYAFPTLGCLTVREIQTEHVLKALKPIWPTKTRTADEVRGQIEKILDAAKTRNLREGENPARWRGHLDNLLSRTDKKKARQRQHFPALHWQHIPALMMQLQADTSQVSFATQLLILTAARSHMIRFARWDEIDLVAATWSLPAERMKTRAPFAIPLSSQALDLLNRLPRLTGNPYLFPGQGKSGVIHANAFRNLLHSLGHEEITTHGFRSTFRDWAGECTHHPREVCELALAHDERSQTESAYSRSDLLTKRRMLMAGWARFICDRSPPDMHTGST